MENLIKKYKEVTFSKELKSLYASSLLRHIGISLIGTFSVIFFFQNFNNSIEKVILLEIVLFGAFLLLTPLTAKLFKRYGLERLMRFATPFLGVSMLALYLLDQTQISAFLALYIASLSLFRIFYWVPYHIELAKSTDNKSRGRQIAIMSNIAMAFSVITPIFSGIIIASFGFSPLFILAMIVALTSVVPLYSLKMNYEEYSFGYLETFKKVFARNNRSLFYAHFSNGMQMIVGSTIWPIYIFLLFEEEYALLGIIASLSVVSLVALRVVVGYLNDGGRKKKFLRYSSMVSGSGWLMKFFVSTPVEVFAADTYHNAGKASQQMTYNHTMYEHAQNNNTFIDEYSVLRETSLNLGRIFMLLLSLLIIRYFPIEVTFIIAALAAIVVSFEGSEKKVR